MAQHSAGTPPRRSGRRRAHPERAAGLGLVSAVAALALVGSGAGTAFGDDDAPRNATQGDGALCTVTGPVDALEPGFDEAVSCLSSGGRSVDLGDEANTVHGAGTGALPTRAAGPTSTTSPTTTSSASPTTTSSTTSDSTSDATAGVSTTSASVIPVANRGPDVPAIDVPPPPGVTRSYAIG